MNWTYLEAIAAPLVERLEQDAGWVEKVRVRMRNGGLIAYYDWEPDPRVSARYVWRKGRERPARTFRFADDSVTEVEKLTPPLIGDEGAEFSSVEALAVAIVAHDDARAWYGAAIERAGGL